MAYDVTANAVAYAQAVRAANARVVVFPEMSLTGYELDAAPVSPDDERLTAIIAACHGERALRVAADQDVWVATAAFAGPTGGGFDRTSGRSGIWSADGKLIAEASGAPDDVVRAVFSKSAP
ncbi:hypothetical protein [Streptomyces sp. SID10815]|uniref:hypothetical protein n=1 Tax=Streptomyces sp. SID10815 TaxID=2706027 RepID=UPI0031BA7BB2